MYFYEGSIHECLLDYENITKIWFDCGSQSDNLIYVLFTQKACH